MTKKSLSLNSKVVRSPSESKRRSWWNKRMTVSMRDLLSDDDIDESESLHMSLALPTPRPPSRSASMPLPTNVSAMNTSPSPGIRRSCPVNPLFPRYHRSRGIVGRRDLEERLQDFREGLTLLQNNADECQASSEISGIHRSPSFAFADRESCLSPPRRN